MRPPGKEEEDAAANGDGSGSTCAKAQHNNDAEMNNELSQNACSTGHPLKV